MKYLIDEIYDFAKEVEIENIPLKVKELTRNLFVDSMGCLIAGYYEDSTQSLLTYLDKKMNRKFELETIRELTAEDRALLYGYISHNFDFDNSSNIIGHNSAVIFPTLLSLSEEHDISGREFVKAYAIGTEVSFKVANKIMPGMNFRGFHITPIFGVLGATTAAAVLLKLNEDDFKNAISIAVSYCSGLMVQFGSSMKFYHCGMAASNAIRAVDLACSGIDGNRNAFEGKSGFYQAYNDFKEVTSLDLGKNWSMLEDSFLIKAYPCCSASHSAIYGLQSLIREEEVNPEKVEKIIVYVPEYTLHNLRFVYPEDTTEAKFSMKFALGNVLKNLDYDFSAFDEDNFNSTTLKEYMDKMEMVSSNRYPEFVEAEPCTLEILQNGEKITKEYLYGLGRTLDSPLKKDELYSKFKMCTKEYLEDPEKSFDIFYGIYNSENIVFNIKRGSI